MNINNIKKRKQFHDARLVLDVSNAIVIKEKKKTIGLLQSLKEKIKQFNKYPVGKKLYIIITSLIKVIAGAAVTTTAVLKAIQMIKKSEGTFEDFVNQKDQFDKPVFPAPVRLAVSGTLTSLRILVKLMGFNLKSNEAASSNKNTASSNQNSGFGSNQNKGLGVGSQPGKPVNMNYSNEPGGILDTIFQNNTKGIISTLNEIKNINEVKNSGADLSEAIKDVKDILDEAQYKMSDRAHRLTSQSVAGTTIKKDLEEAQMRIARIHFILKQKGIVSEAVNRALKSSQDMVVKMLQAVKRMRATDSLFSIKKYKKYKLITHDSMPWSKKKHNDGVISTLYEKIKNRIMTIIAICKSDKNKLYQKIFILMNELLSVLGGVVAIIFTRESISNMSNYLTKLKKLKSSIDGVNKRLEQQGLKTRLNTGLVQGLLNFDLLKFELSALFAALGAFISVLSHSINSIQIKFAHKNKEYLPK